MADIASIDSAEYAAVLEAISKWPSTDRLNMAQAILRTLEPEVRRRRKVSGAAAEGLLAGDYPAPSDADVDRMVSEYLTEKYS
jgi:hypothetical protein